MVEKLLTTEESFLESWQYIPRTNLLFFHKKINKFARDAAQVLGRPLGTN